MAAEQDHPLHFVMLPFMAQGHTIPMVDMARLFARHGVIITIVTTPLNTLRFKTLTDRAIQSGLQIRLLQLHFPCAEAGLPDGCENFDALPSKEMIKNFVVALGMLQEPFEQSIAEMEPRPSCIISDMLFPWTNETARKLDIPRVIFHGMSCFALLCIQNIRLHKIHERVTSETEPFIVPGLPDPIEMTRNCLPSEFYDSTPDLTGIRSQVREAEGDAYGVVVNSFDSLEPRYAQEYGKVKGNKVWCVGPVSLCNEENLDKAERGGRASIEDHRCLKWLDTKMPDSVVYVCLGSLSRLTPLQLIEIGLGLESSNRPFVWVIRKGKDDSELEKWLLEEKFEERIKDRGLIIKGWAPQVLILSHQAIGAFLTHCGWNSTLEGISAGVPLMTLPMFAEQFFNEKLVIQILGIGYKVGRCAAGCPPWEQEKKDGVFVTKEDVENTVRIVMDEGEEGEIRRQKAREVGVNARKAIKEGGCSEVNMTLFIQNMMQMQKAEDHVG